MNRFYKSRNVYDSEDGVVYKGGYIEKAQCDKILQNYSSYSHFDDDFWNLDKVYGDRNSTDTQIVYFHKLSPAIAYDVKQYALKELLARRSVRSIKSFTYKMGITLNYAGREIKSFNDLNESDIMNIYYGVFDRNVTPFTQELYWKGLIKILRELGYNDQYQMMMKYIIPSSKGTKKHDYKLLPEKIVKSLDGIFAHSEEIPLVHKAIYWTMRLFPNRVEEVLSLTTDCLKRKDENTYTLTTPTFKQGGQYKDGSLKMLEIKDTGIGHEYIVLMKKQIEFAKEVSTFENNPKHFMFIGYGYALKKAENKIVKWVTPTKPTVYSASTVNNFLKKVCQRYKIHDDNGDIIHVTTHMFRHSAVTERMNSGIFRAIDIMPMTGHHNTSMIEQTYTHTGKDVFEKKQPIVFKGRIINNPEVEKRRLKKPFAKKLYHLGICSDIRKCNKDKSQCLRCQFFIPEVENLDYFKSETEDWKSKKEKALKLGNKDFAELCSYWIESYEIAIDKINKGLADANTTKEGE